MMLALACDGCSSPLDADDLRCSICARATPARVARREGPIATILRCKGCGAALAYNADVGAPRCAFCREVLVLETPRDPVEQPELVIPFSVTPEVAAGALRAWLGTLGFFRPSDLARTASVEGLVAIAWCGWLVDVDAHVSWTADSNAGTGRSDWAPHAGEVKMPFRRLVIPASRGLRESECVRLVPGYDIAALVPCSSHTPAGTLEHFDVQRSAARRAVVAALENESKRRIATDGTIPGSRFRNVQVSVLLSSLHTKRVALPAYVLAYRYKSTVHRAIVHGQDARLTFGSAPYSMAKIALVALVAVAVLVIIVAVASR